LLALLLIRKRRKSGRSLADVDVTQGQGKCAYVVFDERGVQRLVLMPFDDMRNDGVRECDEVLFGLGRRF